MRCVGGLSLLRRDVGDGQVPVGKKDLEAALLFALVSGLVRPEFLDKPRLVGVRSGGRGRILVADGDAVIPAAVFSDVVSRRFNLERHNAARGGDLLKKRVVVLQEEIEKLLLMSPLNLVVVLHSVGLVG